MLLNPTHEEESASLTVLGVRHSGMGQRYVADVIERMEVEVKLRVRGRRPVVATGGPEETAPSSPRGSPGPKQPFQARGRPWLACL